MHLPAEIFIQIAEAFDEDGIGTLASLCITCHQLHELLDPILYKLAARSIVGGHLAWDLIRNDRISTLQKLLNNGFDINGLCSTRLMNTPFLPLIHHAIKNRKVEIVKLLLKRGVEASNPNLLVTAQSSTHHHPETGRELCQILLQHGTFDPDALHISLEKAVDSGDHEIVRMHLAAGADVHRRFNEIRMRLTQELTFLHKAAMLANLEVCRVLIEYGADISLRIPIRHDFIALRTPFQPGIQRGVEMWTAGEMFEWYCGDTGPEMYRVPLMSILTVFDPLPFYKLLFPKPSKHKFFAEVNPWATE
ncbi:hypothetical protein BZA77DRAFT_306741 [Pyronema omphalodes]|nr:hypothetical protein BZA77DRAFT_306741 [Pyronema omphalodes]